MLQLQKLSNSSQATSKARISHAIQSSRFAVDGDHGSAARRQPVLPDHHHRCGVEPAVAVEVDRQLLAVRIVSPPRAIDQILIRPHRTDTVGDATTIALIF